jgi:hypothetical protein
VSVTLGSSHIRAIGKGNHQEVSRQGSSHFPRDHPKNSFGDSFLNVKDTKTMTYMDLALGMG